MKKKEIQLKYFKPWEKLLEKIVGNIIEKEDGL